MGSGFRTFAAGEVLTASNTQNYLMDQAVMSFANATARDAAVTAPEEGMVAYLQDVDVFTFYTGAAWVIYAQAGAWTSYTPTWSAASGTTTLGNATLTGHYARFGKMIEFNILFSYGTTTTQSISGANWQFAIPVAAEATSTLWPVTGWVLDTSASTRWVCGGYVSAPNTWVETFVPSGTTGIVDDTTPMAWASGDRLNIWGRYEAA